MAYPIQKMKPGHFPRLLSEIADPPERLYIRGEFPDEQKHRFLCVVGSRKYTSYGKDVAEKIIRELAGLPIVIISGLALGIDSIAHKAALKAGLPTVSVPGSGLNDDVIYPRSHQQLAYKILESGGALLSEFEPDFKATPWAFPKRNRIMTGLSHAVLVVEATQKSGTLITSRLATEYNRDVLTVPGSIFSQNSAGPHMLMRLGAAPVTSGEDVAELLGIEKSTEETQKTLFENLSDDEKRVVEALSEPIARDELIRQLDMPTHKANTLLSAMEIKGLIVERLGKVRTST